MSEDMLLFFMSKAALLILILFSCSEQYQFIIDPGLKDYVNSFYYQAELRGIHLQKANLIVRFGNTGEDGGLTKYSVKNGKVSSQIMVWISDEIQPQECVEATVYHELGHALLFRDHCQGVSLMNVRYGNFRCFQNASKEELINEMFDGNNKHQ